MKTRPQKLGNPGKVGQLASKGGKKSPSSNSKMQSLDRPTVGSALGLLGKHFK